jgi:hypothetical protein
MGCRPVRRQPLERPVPRIVALKRSIPRLVGLFDAVEVTSVHQAWQTAVSALCLVLAVAARYGRISSILHPGIEQN